jgi:putative tryptophan/tyrosine transport system substrate-binding protein
MKRKTATLFSAIFFFACFHTAEAEQASKLPRIGLLFIGESSPPSPNLDAFRQGLRDLGYIEGKNIILEYRYADGKVERLPELAEELVRLPVDVIVTAASPAIHAARKVTNKIPIVFAASGNPMATGYIESLAHPGGNVTGLSVMDYELSGKRLELITDVLRKKTSRVAVLWNPGNGAMVLKMKEVSSAAQGLRVDLKSLEVRSPQDFDPKLAALPHEHADALLTLLDPLTLFHRDRIVDAAGKARLPGMYEDREFVDAGGLMSYGPSFESNYRRAAVYVDKILKGAKPGDLPVEQPTKFELVINLKTAKQIGLTIPPNVLARADRVIK